MWNTNIPIIIYQTVESRGFDWMTLFIMLATVASAFFAFWMMTYTKKMNELNGRLVKIEEERFYLENEDIIEIVDMKCEIIHLDESQKEQGILNFELIYLIRIRNIIALNTEVKIIVKAGNVEIYNSLIDFSSIRIVEIPIKNPVYFNVLDKNILPRVIELFKSFWNGFQMEARKNHRGIIENDKLFNLIKNDHSGILKNIADLSEFNLEIIYKTEKSIEITFILIYDLYHNKVEIKKHSNTK